MGRTLMIIGALLLLVGGVVWALERFFPGLGRLPGDIVIQRENFTFYFPLATSILLSLGLTLLLWLWRKFGG
ncbi:MAG: DUF2905 domain-containing protein [Bacillota bacterium]